MNWANVFDIADRPAACKVVTRMPVGMVRWAEWHDDSTRRQWIAVKPRQEDLSRM